MQTNTAWRVDSRSTPTALRVALLLPLSLCATLADAATVTSFSPQGAVRDVRQVTARFSEAVVKFGDPRLPDPFTVECAAKGKGRWADGRNWVYDFEADLAAGEACTFTLVEGLKTLTGESLSGKDEFSFATGGPAIRASMPYEGATIDENQVFALGLDAPVTDASVAKNAFCAIDGVEERIPLTVLTGKDREELLSKRRVLGYAYYSVLWKDGDSGDVQVTHDALKKAEKNVVVARCSRPLPNATTVKLVWGKGVATPSGLETVEDQVKGFRVRDAFTARFSCDRVNADAPCVPVLAMNLTFSAPVSREQAEKIRLVGKETRKPNLGSGEDRFVESVSFDPPFPTVAQFQVQLPADVRDDAGRAIENRGSYPLAVATDEAPPLAKFNGEFGILERSEGGVLPITIRDLEDKPSGLKIGGQSKRIDTEAGILDWMKRVRVAMNSRWEDSKFIQPGIDSVFAGEEGTPFDLPKREGGKAFEVIGIPLGEPGFHVVEIASPRLGAALLGDDRPRYVATTALVTNLAVHFKWGKEGSLVFVSTLDGAKPVVDAVIHVVDGCDGKPIWEGRTGTDGAVRIDSGLPTPKAWSSCSNEDSHPVMVSARKDDDLSFTISDWNQGITPSDFNLESGLWESSQVAHTVLDRSLFRAGETVSMKHFWREHTAKGLAVPEARPTALVIEHEGSGSSVTLPLNFDAKGVAESQWAIPKEARLGEYQLRFTGKDIAQTSGSFRVEQYRIPQMRAVITPPAEPAVAVKALPLDLYVGYFSGGAAAKLPVKLRTQVRPRAVTFQSYDSFSFGGTPLKAGIVEGGEGGYFPDDESGADDAARPLPAQTLPLTLDANGSARTTIADLPASAEAQEVFSELEYPDANGELTSVRATTPLWPAKLVVGLSGDDWSGKSDELKFQAVVLDLKGRPLASQRVTVQLWSKITHSYRKRLVGGFYAYSHSEETIKLDAACREKTDAQGLIRCKVAPRASGQVLLEALAQDADGHTSRAVASRYVAGKDDWWFAQADNDRMDLIPEQREVEPGATARLQVRMPFRKATALVTVEREGVLRSYVTEISGKEPVIEVPIDGADSPNVYVSVLAVRGRVSDFRSRFYDFLRWLHLDRWFRLDGGMPTAMVDLSKPAYRLGMARIDVGWSAHRLKVEVKPGEASYKTRGKAVVQVQVTPAAGGAMPADAEIAFSAVDEALLDLHANNSVYVLEQMMQRRGVSVLTSTAQMQVVGKRHYGRKSLPPGGGGGRGAVRELLDSLLLWKARVPLDAQGHATVEVPLNDALSSFKLTAVASVGADRFGTGSASIRTTQDFQLISGVPPLVRENDRYEAIFTVRNTTREAREIEVEAEAIATGLKEPLVHASQKLNVPAGEALPARFELTAPFDVSQVSWTVRVQDKAGEPLDALKIVQEVVPAYPVRVYQATLSQLEGSTEMPVERPADAIVGRGGVRVNLQASLTASLDPVRDWARLYPYTCYEQGASRAVVLEDRAMWDQQMARLSSYLDSDGLVRYFPSTMLEGSDTLTAYLLAIAQEAGWPIPESDRNLMIEGLAGFLEGRVDRGSQIRIADQTERKLAAIEALSRYKLAKAAWVTSLTIDPNLWHTSAVIDWIGILQRVSTIPERDRLLEEAKTILRSRLNFKGTTMGFSAEQDDALWWLMISADVNANRAILALLGDSAWREDLPRMMRGAIGRQHKGHWNITTANAWGVLATRKFASAFERESVGGVTTASLGAAQQRKDWKDPANATLDLAWPDGPGVLKLAHEGTGKPWIIVQSRAALPLKEPFSSGYRIKRTVTPVEQAVKGKWTRGDTARIKLEIDAQSDMTWVVVEDPVPGGSTILGGGLGRDSQLLAQGEEREGEAWPAFEERRFDFYRAYYALVPKGAFSLEYTVRYNNAGRFVMPATRVEAMYSPEMLGESPNAPMQVDVP